MKKTAGTSRYSAAKAQKKDTDSALYEVVVEKAKPISRTSFRTAKDTNHALMKKK